MGFPLPARAMYTEAVATLRRFVASADTFVAVVRLLSVLVVMRAGMVSDRDDDGNDNDAQLEPCACCGKHRTVCVCVRVCVCMYASLCVSVCTQVSVCEWMYASQCMHKCVRVSDTHGCVGRGARQDDARR
jgi:hypothetical protein